MEIKHIKNLSEIESIGNKFGYATTLTGKADPIVLDSKDTHYIVDEWQDLWYRGDVTIRNVEFAKGVSFYAQGAEKRKIVIEDCIIKWCDQKNDLLPKLDKDSNFRIDNSGNGLCLSFDGKEGSQVDVEVRNCTLIGDNNTNGERKDSFKSKDDYANYKSAPSTFDTKKYKGRGNGVGIGTASGKGIAFTSVLIDGCSFEGLRNAAVQLYTFNCPITISNCDFKSWGINKDDIAETYTYAIRGNVNATSHANASLTIKNCTFDHSKPDNVCNISDLDKIEII